MPTDQPDSITPLTEARMLEVAREAGLIITTQAEADMVTLLGRAIEKALGVVERVPAPEAKTALDDSYQTLDQRITTLVNTHHSHLVVGDVEAARKALVEVVDICKQPQPRQLVSVSSIDVEKLIAACVPGGNLCDPQEVADNIRRYCNAWPSS